MRGRWREKCVAGRISPIQRAQIVGGSLWAPPTRWTARPGVPTWLEALAPADAAELPACTGQALSPNQRGIGIQGVSPPPQFFGAEEKDRKMKVWAGCSGISG